MDTQTRPIRYIALLPTGKLFAHWYCFWGIVSGIVFVASRSEERLNVLLGLFIPFVDLHLNFRVQRAPTWPGVVSQAFFFVLFCAATGWVSGILAAYVYNLISRHFGLQLRGTTEEENL